MRALYLATDVAASRWLQKLWPDAELDVCSSVQAAQAALTSREFEAILTDVQLAEGSALTFIKYVRGSGLTVPVVALAAQDGPMRSAALAAGADDYIIKSPKLPQAILGAIAAVADRRALEHASRHTALHVLYVGDDDRLQHHLSESPAVSVTTVPFDFDQVEQLDACDVAVIDIDGLEAIRPVWKLRRTSPDLPVVLVMSRDRISTSGTPLPFGLDDVIVRSPNYLSHTVPRLRQLVSRRPDGRKSPSPQLTAVAADARAHVSAAADESTPAAVAVETPAAVAVEEPTPPVSVQEPAASTAAEAPAPTDALAVREPEGQRLERAVTGGAVTPRPASGGWLRDYLDLHRQAQQASGALRVVAAVDALISEPRPDSSARARAVIREFLAYSACASEGATHDLDREVADLIPALRPLLGAFTELGVDCASAGHVFLAREEIQRLLTSMAFASRDALPLGGRLLIETRAGTLPADDLPLPPGTLLPVVQLRVLAIGSAPLAIEVGPGLSSFIFACGGSYDTESIGPDTAQISVYLPQVAPPR